MGREVKRVSMDFDWPLNLIWKGYLNPYTPEECKVCGGSGLNKETRQLSDDWYDFGDTGRKWMYNLTDHEIQALLDSNRLVDLTHYWKEGEGWVRIEGYTPTAEEVNAWAQKGIGHDSFNRWICVEARAKKLGILGYCPMCNGKGHYWCDDSYQKLYEGWEPIEPPEGEGIQIWENVSEGSPVSPVFDNKEELAQWMVDNNTSILHNSTYDDWMAFLDEGYCVSGVVNIGTHTNGVESCNKK